MKKQRILSVLLCMGMAVSMLAGCGSADGGSGSSDGKEQLVLMLDVSDSPAIGQAAEMAKEHFADKYDIIIKEWSLTGVEKAIKTAAAGGTDSSIDISFGGASKLPNYLDADLLLDLTDYIEEDPEWKDQFQDGAFDSSTFDEKIYGVPFQTVYPLLLVNNDIIREAGMEVKDCWTWEEFQEVCKAVDEKTDAYPFGCSSDWAPWLARTGFINAFEGEEYDEFVNGDISFHDDRVVEVMDNVANMYQSNYCYPGEGAVSATLDQISAAFAQEKVAIMACVNSVAGSTIETSGLKNVSVVTMPSFIHTDIDTQELGGNDCFFIPSNTKNADAAVEVLKYLTSKEVVQMMADAGVVVPQKEVQSSDPNYSLYSKDIGRLVPYEFYELSSEVNEYQNNSLLVDYLYTGDAALDNLQNLVDEAKASK